MKRVHNAAFQAACRQLALEHHCNLYNAAFYRNGEYDVYTHQIANPSNDCYSVSKLFCMFAVGMLCDAGQLNADDRITAILKDEILVPYDPAWDAVTIGHTLSHRMGIDETYRDIDSEDRNNNASDDYLALALRGKPARLPGSYYQYSDAAYYLLSRVVTKVTGVRLDDFLMERLFRPLHFAEAAWSKCPYGYTMGCTGLFCHTEDMLKLGVILLNGGVYERTRYLSESWVHDAIENGWGLARCESRSYGKTGANGQIVAFCPDTDSAIAIHCFSDDSPYPFRGAAIREFLEKETNRKIHF